MKEKITKAEFINTWASEWDERTGWKVSEEYHKQFSEQLESIINQEVEKRIKERIKNLPRYDIVEYDGGMCRHMDGDWLNFEEVLSRLTCSEKPNNSQKTEGGAK